METVLSLRSVTSLYIVFYLSSSVVVMPLLYIDRQFCQWQLSQFERFYIFYLSVDISFDLVIVQHNTISVNGDVVGCGSVDPADLASVTAYDDVSGGIHVTDEVLKVSHNVLP